MATTATTWGSRIGFILAGAGSAIGLGSIWKFPFWAGINGGSGFIIPYIIFTFTIGITLLIAELVVGRAGRGSALHALKHTSELDKLLISLPENDRRVTPEIAIVSF